MGYCGKYADHGIVNNRPVMVGYQAHAGAAPFILGKMVDQSRDRRHRDSHRPSAVLGQGLGGAEGIERLVR